jgi:hypothetical protein
MLATKSGCFNQIPHGPRLRFFYWYPQVQIIFLFVTSLYGFCIFFSVPDSLHFDTDTDPWIRTLDYGSRYGSGSGSCTFRQWLSRCKQKIIFFYNLVFWLRRNMSFRSHKAVEIKVFLNFFTLFIIFLFLTIFEGLGV